MSTHINHLNRTCFYHIRQLRTVRRSLTVDTTHALVRALVHSRNDYCNSVLAGQPKYCFDKLQSVLRASAQLVVRLPGRVSVRSSADNCTGCHSRKECSQDSDLQTGSTYISACRRYKNVISRATAQFSGSSMFFWQLRKWEHLAAHCCLFSKNRLISFVKR